MIVASLAVGLLAWVALLPWAGTGRRPVGEQRRAVDRAQPPGPLDPPVELVVVLDLLGAALGSGIGIPQAFEAVGQALGGRDGAHLRAVGAALVLGAPWETAWATAPSRFAVLASALAPAWKHGAAPGDGLRVAGAQLVQDARARGRRAAARLGVQLVLPLGLCLLPAFVLVGLVPVLVSLGSGVLG